MQHANHLEVLNIEGVKIEGREELPETDKVNLVELTSRLIEAQEDTNMKDLSLMNLSKVSVDELTEEDMYLLNACLGSPITQLTTLKLSKNAGWFANREAWPILFSFIQE